jgi:hypothetical protein
MGGSLAPRAGGGGGGGGGSGSVLLSPCTGLGFSAVSGFVSFHGFRVQTSEHPQLSPKNFRLKSLNSLQNEKKT